MIGTFITIPAWKTFGMVIDKQPAHYGSEGAIRVLVETRPDDVAPRWYNLEPDEYIQETT